MNCIAIFKEVLIHTKRIDILLPCMLVSWCVIIQYFWRDREEYDIQGIELEIDSGTQISLFLRHNPHDIIYKKDCYLQQQLPHPNKQRNSFTTCTCMYVCLWRSLTSMSLCYYAKIEIFYNFKIEIIASNTHETHCP